MMLMMTMMMMMRLFVRFGRTFTWFDQRRQLCSAMMKKKKMLMMIAGCHSAEQGIPLHARMDRNNSTDTRIEVKHKTEKKMKENVGCLIVFVKWARKNIY